MSQFAFLSADFPDLLDYARKAEAAALSDPRGACFWGIRPVCLPCLRDGVGDSVHH